MNLDFSFVTKEWVNKQTSLKTILIKKWGNSLRFIKPLNVCFDDPNLNLLGSGIVVDTNYNIIHASFPRIKVGVNKFLKGKEMFGGVLIRILMMNEKIILSGLNHNEFILPTTNMDKILDNALASDYILEMLNRRYCFTALIGLESIHFLNSFNLNNGLLENLNFDSNFCKTENILNDLVVSTLNKQHYVAFRLFQNNVFALYNLYLHYHIRNRFAYIPKKYKSLLYELHGIHLKSKELITKRHVADLIDNLNPWKFEQLLLS